MFFIPILLYVLLLVTYLVLESGLIAFISRGTPNISYKLYLKKKFLFLSLFFFEIIF